MDNNILDIIEALKKSQNIKIEYKKIFELICLSCEQLSFEKNDIDEFNEKEYQIYDSYLDLSNLMKFLKSYLDISLQYLDEDDFDEITQNFKELVDKNQKLVREYSTKSKQKKDLKEIKKKVDEITPKIEELRKEILKYQSLDLDKTESEYRELRNSIDTTYNKHKIITNSIEKAKKQKDELENENSINKGELFNIIDELENLIEIKSEEEREKLTKQINKFQKFQKELEENKKELEIYRKHFNENIDINLSIENNEVAKELNTVISLLNSSDNLIQEQLKLEKKMKDIHISK